MGRPSTYSREIADQICVRVANGETLNQICRDEGMPPRRTVVDWALKDVDGFSARYARAREHMLDFWADEVADIADDGSNDWMERETKAGKIVATFDYEHALRSRLRVDTRKWLLSKLKPEKYGDRVEVHTHKHKDVTPEPEGITVQKKDSWLERHGNGKGPALN